MIRRLALFESELSRPAAAVLAINVLGALAWFLMALALARLLGADGSGVFYLAFSVASIASLLGRLGLDGALVRFISPAAAERSWDQVRGIYRRGATIALASSALLGGLLVLAGPWLANSIFDLADAETVFRIGGAFVPIHALLQIQTHALRSVSRPLQAALIQNLGPPAMAVALVVLGDIETPGAALVAMIVSGATWLIVGRIVWSFMIDSVRSEAISFPAARLLEVARPLLVVGSIQLVMTWTDTVMLGLFEESAAVGLYAPALRVAALVSLVLTALNTVAPPRFAVLFGAGRTAELEQLVRQTARLGMLVALPATVVVLLGAHSIMLLFGSEFTEASNALRILAIGQLVNAGVGSVGSMLSMTGHERFLQRSMLVAAAANLVLNAALIPLWGINGAAAATAASVIAVNILNVAYVRARINIQPLPMRAARHS